MSTSAPSSSILPSALQPTLLNSTPVRQRSRLIAMSFRMSCSLHVGMNCPATDAPPHWYQLMQRVCQLRYLAGTEDVSMVRRFGDMTRCADLAVALASPSCSQ